MRGLKLFLALLIVPVGSSTAQEVNVRCVAGGKEYVFSINDRERTLHQINPNGPYSFPDVTIDTLRVTGRTPFRNAAGEDSGKFIVGLDRVTGEVILTWTDPFWGTEAGQEECRADARAQGQEGWWCSDVVGVRSAVGRCQRTERLF
jgi:hypothetical protein